MNHVKSLAILPQHPKSSADDQYPLQLDNLLNAIVCGLQTLLRSKWAFLLPYEFRPRILKCSETVRCCRTFTVCRTVLS